MTIDISDLTDYAWADVAKAAKSAMVTAAVGGSEYQMPDGRMLRRLSIEEASKLYNFSQKMIAAEASGEDGGNVLVQFGDAV